MQTIYVPGGRALEYADFALNIYPRCNHGCDYPCYAESIYDRWHGKGAFRQPFEGREGLLQALNDKLRTGRYAGKLIHICFSCDPYPAPPVDTQITRDVIIMLKSYSCHVQILTKGGMRAIRDFDLLDGEDWFGITISGNEAAEPGAAPSIERWVSLQTAKHQGTHTWVSFEPVFDPHEVYFNLQYREGIDLYRIGKLNYHPSEINWGEFGRRCEELAAECGRKIYIKEDLRRAMEGK